MNVLDGGCFMALSDSMVAIDLRMIEEFAMSDLNIRLNKTGGLSLFNACLLEKSKAGLWYVYAMVESSGCDIDDCRVAGLICLADSVFDPIMVSTDYLLGLPWTDLQTSKNGFFSNQVQIECGTIGFLCLESIRRCAGIHGLGSGDYEKFSNFMRSWANAMCQATTSSCKFWLSNVPNGPIGAVSSVGICDNGKYNCEVIRDEITGEIGAFKVMFPVPN